MPFLPSLILIIPNLALALSTSSPVLYFTLARRGGAFPTDNVANLTFLSQELIAAEARFNLTRREMKGNKVLRKAKEKGVGGGDFNLLMGEVGQQRRWYGKIAIGEPPQEIEMDLDLLTSDFFVFTTTSSKGSKYDDLFSSSYLKSNEHPFPRCRLPTDKFRLPNSNVSLPLSFVHCRPTKSGLNTLLASGSMLGLASSDSLSQTGTPSLTKQLVAKTVVEKPIWSIMLINGQEGILSIGGTCAAAVEQVIQQTTDEMNKFGELEKAMARNATPHREGATPPRLLERDIAHDGMKEREADWEKGWKWSKVQGAEGWWQILMQGVWVDGSKVLKNQPVVIDLNTPFILAPPLAARTFYTSISGARPLPAPFSSFYTFPCLNPPTLHFEFGGWNFPAMQGGKGLDHSWGVPPGGKFSLGRVAEGSGYCVGNVVESRMGVRDDGTGLGGGGAGGRGGLAGNGMRDVWVLGEGFFRGTGGVFDFKEQRVGMRTF
ncbi:MAG: hypothetical protein M1827_001802 [Pycnora praestabilis]|nr:MAG: hypothetical protein M1827_001802 [Pycnora praestabilis]